MAEDKINKEEIEELRRLIKLLKKEISELDFNNLIKSGGAAKDYLRQLREEAEEFTSNIEETAISFKSIVNEIRRTYGTANDVARSFNKLSSIAEQIKYHQNDINKLSLKEIDSLKTKARIEFEKLKLSEDSLLKRKLDLSSQLEELNIKKATQGLTEAELRERRKLGKEYDKTKTALENVKNIISDQNDAYKNLELTLGVINNKLQNRIENEKKLLGLGGAVTAALSTSLQKLGFGGLSNQLGIDEAKDKMRALANEIIDDREKEASLIQSINKLKKESDSVSSQLNEKEQKLLEAKEKLKELEDSGAGKKKIRDAKELVQSLERQVDVTRQRKNELDGVLARENEILKTTSAQNSKFTGINGKIAVLKEGLASMGGSLKKNLLDPSVIASTLAGGLVTIFKKFFDLLVEADKNIGNLAKGMNISYQEASALNQSLGEAAKNVGGLYNTSRTWSESLVAINQSLGSSARASDETLKTFTELRERAGYTNEELASIYKLTLATNGSLEDNVKSFAGTVKALNAQNKLTINEKQLLKEVSKVSDSIKLSVGGTVEAIAAAAFKTKQFGINLEQADKMAEGLLNFEESISNEISAELLTGKQINLERARLLALNGDIAGAAAEILQQVEGSAEFSAMNRIQQEAIAKAVGLSRDELAKSLVEREALQKIGVKDVEAAKKKFDLLVKEKGYAAAIAELGDEAYATQLAQTSLAEDMNAIIMQLQEMFIPIANELLPKIKDFFIKNEDTIKNMLSGVRDFAMVLANILGDSDKLSKIFDGIKIILIGLAALKLTSLIVQLTSAAVASGALAAGTAAAASAITFGVAAITIAAGIASIMAAYNDAKSQTETVKGVKDGVINSSGLVVGSYEKGVIQPIAQGAPEDNVIFTTNKISSTNKTSNTQIQNQQPINADLNILIKEQQRTNALLTSILNKEGKIHYDSDKAGKNMNINTYSIQ